MPFPTLINWILFPTFLYVCYRSIRRSLRRRQSTTEPTCAHCGYTVLHLTTPTCPECGSNLRLKGVIPPSSVEYRFGLPLLWTIAVLVLGCISANYLSSIVYRKFDAQFTLTSIGPPPPAFVVITAYAEGYSAKQCPQEVAAFAAGRSLTGEQSALSVPLHLSRDSATYGGDPGGPTGTLEFFPQTHEWAITAPSYAARLALLDDASLDRWLVALGYSSDLSRAHELHEAIGAVQSTSDLYHFGLTRPAFLTKWLPGNSLAASCQPASAVQSANAWLFAFLWALTLGPILIRRPKPLYGANAANLLGLLEPALPQNQIAHTLSTLPLP